MTSLLLVAICLLLVIPLIGQFQHNQNVVVADYPKLTNEQLFEYNADKRPGLDYLNEVEIAEFGFRRTGSYSDAFLTTYELVRNNGYTAEVHRVQTIDGYILEMHRIPGTPSKPPKEGKRVVYLQHGLFDSSATWILMGIKTGLGYILADLGFDVWLGNARGNRYSRNHVDNDPDGYCGDRKRFWDFSWHEIGTIDLPAMIDYISQVTRQKRMHYVGHSQGTTSYFVMCSERPEFNDRIITAHMLSPVAYMGNLRSPFVQFASLFVNFLASATKLLGIYEFFPNNKVMTALGQAACRDGAFLHSMCSNVLFLLGGYNSARMNTTMLPVIMGHTPAGASTKQLVHYGQLIRSESFRQFDYGFFKNIWKYGIFHPPTYNLGNIRAPTTLYYALNDWLSEPTDVRELHSQMSSQLPMIEIDDALFSHLDYIWSNDVKTLVYEKLVDIIKKSE